MKKITIFYNINKKNNNSNCLNFQNLYLILNIKRKKTILKLKSILFIKYDLFHISHLLNTKRLNSFIKNSIINFQINKDFLTKMLNFLKLNSSTQYKYLNEQTAYDVPTSIKRFTLNYIVSSLIFNSLILVNVKINELESVPTISNIFKSAGWSERETWDMFGICFTEHKDLRRILTDYNFAGHPLRKDFPLTGYHDLFFDEKHKKTIYVPVELAQEYRKYNFNSSWKK